MRIERCLYGGGVRGFVLFIVLSASIIFSGAAFAYEPISPFDDVFGVPSKETFIDSASDFPGSEGYAGKGFAALGWKTPFGIDELATTSLTGGINFGKAGAFASVNSAGFDLYGEEQEKIGLSYAPFGFISFGMRLTRNTIRIKGFGDADALGADIGIVAKPVEGLYIGASMDDITGAELGESKEPVDSAKRFSVSWETPGGFTLIAKSVKNERFKTSFSGGFMTEIYKVLTLGAGGGTEPDRIEFICGAAMSKLKFIYRGSNCRELGMSHGFTMNWALK
jgi:hypothetical protein